MEAARARPAARALVRGSLCLLVTAAAAAATIGAAAEHGSRDGAGIRTGVAVAADSEPAPCRSGTCWVDVSVATVWVEPWYPRAVDKPALGNPAYPGTWVRNMTLAQKRWLVGRLETQALYGTKVIVAGRWRSWTQVAVTGQPTNLDSRGYPGWIPSVQLTRTAPPAASTTAVIRPAAAWLWSRLSASGVGGSKVMMASFDTRLPVVRVAARYVQVELIGGRVAVVGRRDVVLHAAGTSWGATRAKIVAQARRFLGLQYLWAGTSGFGFDCSGFTYSVYRAYGVTLSRDADQQAVHGTPVARGALQPGDLVFFRDNPAGPVSHVGLYIGGGNMIDSPHTGAAIRIEPIASFPYYAGARRYLRS
jgi:gamma-D-glutamyl-L-lysine dipeptidyl-peptidase